MERLFIDTSAWFAFANRRDPQHSKVRDALCTFSGRVVTSNFIFDETVSLCLYRLGYKPAKAVGSVLMDPNEVDLVRVTAEDERAAWDLFCHRADQHYSFTDCTSFVVMRRLVLHTALALDADFSAEGFGVVP
jgi:predicted nucleic acid-binding protein